jgi:hypothetical protein
VEQVFQALVELQVVALALDPPLEAVVPQSKKSTKVMEVLPTSHPFIHYLTIILI